MKYLVIIAVILGLFLAIQRGCGRNWKERQQQRQQRIEDRREYWRERRENKKIPFENWKQRRTPAPAPNIYDPNGEPDGVVEPDRKKRRFRRKK